MVTHCYFYRGAWCASDDKQNNMLRLVTSDGPVWVFVKDVT